MQNRIKTKNTENLARQFFGLAFIVFLLGSALLGMRAWAGGAQKSQVSAIAMEKSPNRVARSLKVRRSISNRQLRRLQRMGSLTRALASRIR
tara:strand:+ start:142 stop:417 length:276 start_codon:yes stop_codon:yes gene_type:complete